MKTFRLTIKVTCEDVDRTTEDIEETVLDVLASDTILDELGNIELEVEDFCKSD